jgi:hypothetical protein
MYRFVILCLFFCVGCQEKEPCDYIEDYYQDVYEAELADWQKDYQKAYDILKQVKSRCGLLNQSLIREPEMMAKLCIKVGKPQAAFPYIERMLKEGMSFDSFVNNDTYTILHEYEEWRYLERNAARLAAESEEGINKELREEIIAMNDLDQAVRIQESRKKDMKTIDSIHKKRIKEIFKEYGYPHDGLVGKSSMGERTDIKVLLMHFLEPDYFSPLLIESTRKGIAPPGYVGFIVDRKDLAEKDSFTYGIYDNADASRIKDFENLDKRRISVGLPPWKLKKKVDSLRRAYYNYQ